MVALLLFSLGFAGVGIADEPQHEHPDEMDDNADLASVERWLGGNMGKIHVDCTEGINVGNFDACEDLDEEYKSHLDRYVTVAGDVGGDETEERAERFNETRRQQAKLAELMQAFNQTYDDYRDARTAGNETRAQEKARELRRLADRIRELGGEVAVNFRELDGSVGADLDAAATKTQESTREVVLLTNSIEQETFEPTRITVSIDEVATFREPATVTGTVRNATGTSLSNATVTVSDSTGQTTVETNATGQFQTTYRPVSVETGPRDITVNHVPDDTSEYLSSNVTSTVEVRPVDSLVTITNATNSARFDETITVRGEVRSDEHSVPGVRVTVYAGDEVLTTTRTNEAGIFETTARLPADVPTGERPLSVRASEPGQAISPSRTQTPLRVLSTSTNLSTNAEYTAGSEGIRVTGRLSAGNTSEIGERPLTVSINGEEYNTMTNSNGDYALTVDAAEGQHAIVVRYDESGTNLQSATAETMVEPTEDSAGGVIGASSNDANTFFSILRESPILAGVIGLALTVNVIIWPFLWYWRRVDSTDDADSVAEEIEDEATVAESVEHDRSRALLAAARDQLERSPKDAVQAGYAAVRAGLSDSSDDTTAARTHWEFYHSVSDELDGDRASALQSVTEAFEQATFAPGGIDSSRAATMLDEVERCLTASDGGTTD
jgi:hypothetical protein